MARREWAGKIVKQEMTGYHWNARIRKSTVLLPDIAAKLLVKEHARAVQVVKARDKWLLGGGYDNMSPDFQAGYHQACHHILADMQKGRA